MQKADFDAFRDLLNGLGQVFGKKLPDAMVQAYWLALQDVALSTVKHFAEQCTRYGKYFPKPSELRPKLEQSPAARSSAMDTMFRDAQTLSSENLDELCRVDRSTWARIVREKVYAVGRRKGMSDAAIAAKIAAYAPSR